MTPVLTDQNAAHPQPATPGWLRRRLAAPLPKALQPPAPEALANNPFLAFAHDPAAAAAGWRKGAASERAADATTAAPRAAGTEPETLESLLAHLAPPPAEAERPHPPSGKITRRHLEPRDKRKLLRAALELPIPFGEPVAATPVRAWRPMTNAEWTALEPFVRNQGPGRPVQNPRLRLDLVFAVATSGAPWRESTTLAANGVAMTGDTLSRQFRRWTHAGLWRSLLFALVRTDCPAPLKAIEYWILRAARRAMRLMGLAALTLARILGKLTALPLPPALLPNRILSETAADMQAALYRRSFRVAHEPLHRMLDAIQRAAWRRRPWSRHLAPA